MSAKLRQRDIRDLIRSGGAVFLSLAEGRLYADCRRDAALFTVI